MADILVRYQESACVGSCSSEWQDIVVVSQLACRDPPAAGLVNYKDPVKVIDVGRLLS